MKKLYFLFVLACLVCFPFATKAQGVEYQTVDYAFPMYGVFHPMQTTTDTTSGVLTMAKAAPKPSMLNEALKAKLDRQRIARMQSAYRENYTGEGTGKVLNPEVNKGFTGAISGGIPNDNNIAVSKSGWVVSVLNTFIRVYDDTGKFMKNWDLTVFVNDANASKPGGAVAPLDRSYDPKVTYDPVNSRFIIVYLEGSLSNDTRIITCFSKTDNPLEGWNIYVLDGNPFGGQQWSDYPIIAQSEDELFVTVNILLDNTDWRDGFQQSVIWQIDKNKGYSGDTLQTKLWYDIKFKNKPIWSICGVQGGLQPEGKGLFLLSVRPGDTQNDTLFLHHINDNQYQPNVSLTTSVLKTDVPYGLPANAFQKGGTNFRLQSNDARVLSAMIHDNVIQYVQTTKALNGLQPSIFHGFIYNPLGDKRTKGRIYSSDTLDLAYPSICYTGNGFGDQSALITFSHSAIDKFPGTSAIYVDRVGGASQIIRIKSGLGRINSFLADSMERWGDYTGVQRDYAKPGQVWIVGSFGTQLNLMGTWVSKVTIQDDRITTSPLENYQLYPNPVSDRFFFEFDVLQPESLRFEIYDMQGRKVQGLETDKMLPGRHLLKINTTFFTNGLYVLRVFDPSGMELFSDKFFVSQ